MSDRPLRGQPLHGQRVVVTRAVDQAAALRDAFAAAGAEVVGLPLIEVVPPGDERPVELAAEGVAGFDWLVFTSANAVRAFLPRVASTSALPPVAVVGPATAAALRSFGIEPRLEPEHPRAEALAGALASEVSGGRVLLPRAGDARPELIAGLRAAGAEVTAPVAYRKQTPAGVSEPAARLFADGPLGWVTFTSPRIVGVFAELLGANWEARRAELRALSIGPVTSRALRRLGVEPAAEASSPGADELVRAMIAAGEGARWGLGLRYSLQKAR